MNSPVFDTKRDQTILQSVREGMKVRDSNMEELGTVDRIYLGEMGSEATSQVAVPATVTPINDPTDGLSALIQGAFGGEELPDELQQRLLQKGFIHINVAGILAHDRYVVPDQIAQVMPDGVVLKAARAELIKEPS